LAPYMSVGIPATVIITKKGYWVVQRHGPSKWDTQEMIEYLNKLINEKEK
jgi:hypothetical protein